MRKKTSRLRLAGSEYIGCAIAGCILLMQTLFFLHLYVPMELSAFLSSSASGWAQAIGAVLAIFASFRLGERSFRRQISREEIVDLRRKLHSYEVMHEIFGAANAVDTLCAHIAEHPDLAKAALAAAKDTLTLIRSVPVMDTPEGDHVRQLNLCSQAMLSYIGWSEQFGSSGRTDILAFWQEFAKGSMEHSSQFMEDSLLKARYLKRDIAIAAHNLH